MNLKEFDAKQFLLEKGEQVGLGIAVTLMVLMLIWSLFLPPHGFFSGSPAEKANDLKKNTDQLETALRTKQPGEKDLPEKREGRLIDLDTAFLQPANYATANWFEPRIKENPSRRPPKIYNVEEAVAEVRRVLIDSYLFQSNFTKIVVLTEDGKRNASGGGPAGMNPFAPLAKGGMPPMPSGGGMMGRMMGRFYDMNQRRLGRNPMTDSLVGVSAAEKPQYTTRPIPVDNWNPQDLTARQLRPLRMAIIAGSFPYRRQLEEHKKKLRHKSIEDVLNETVGEGDKQAQAFRFLGVEVQRMEVDADGKKINDWATLPLKETYELWLKHTYWPFEPEEPKIYPIRFKGLVLPLLREFHASKANTPGLPGMIPGLTPPGVSQPNPTREEAPAEGGQSKYPDVVAKLPKIQETLAKLSDVQPKQIAKPKFRQAKVLDLFDPDAVPGDNTAAAGADNKQGEANANQGSTIPDYVLVRVVDVNIEPGKHYRYRLRIKMANPNYKRSDVASPTYKDDESLESKEWYELKDTVSVPQETFYYVVDEKQSISPKELRNLPKESAQYRMLRAAIDRGPAADQVVFQFHRWVEATSLSSKEKDMVPVGEWAVAERVPVARGEYVGRQVKVDLPIWKYTQNDFILPAEDQKVRPGRKPKTGIDVDFGQDPPENNRILVDFEGGQVASPSDKKVHDTSRIEVLMLSPDGKLLARNSAKDTEDKERKDRRKEVLDRIQEVREGKGTE